jgi:drug/metabolite transporter (DMT)-like permease
MIGAVSASPLTAPPESAAASAVRPGTWLPSFVVLCAIWGSSFLFIKVGVRELHPAWVAFGRVFAGAVALSVSLLVTRDRLPGGGRIWARMALLALLGNVIPFTLFGYGERHVSSIVAGIWNATTPLMVLVVSLAFLPAERPTAWRAAGLGVGFAGVLVVLGVWQGIGGGELAGQLCCAGAAACYGFAIPYTRRIVAGRTESGISLAATQLAVASLELVLVAPVLAGAPPAPWHLSWDVAGSVLALGALGTGLAFALNYRVIALAGATVSASVTYVVPIFATLLGVVVLGEPLHWYEPVGAVVILAGVALATRSARPLPRRS